MRKGKRAIMSRHERLLGLLKAKLANVKTVGRVRISAKAELSVWEGGSIQIGDGSVIHRGAILSTYPGGHIRIGKDCSVNPYCVLYGHGGLVIGDHVRIAAHTVMIPANHRHSDAQSSIRSQGLDQRGIVIGDDVWIGAGVRILDGVEILSGCVIAAGAVVNRSTPEPGVYAGVPARLVKRRGTADDGPTVQSSS